MWTSTAAVASALLLTPAVAFAQERPAHTQAAVIEIDSEATFQAGARGTVAITVSGPWVNDRVPLLLTVRVDGTAAELLRGRFFRSDGSYDGEAGAIYFAVPLVGRDPGGVVLSAELRTFHCRQRCRPITVEGHTRIRVEP